MNHSIYGADRTTHLKVVVVALMAGIAIAGFGLMSHLNSNAASARMEAVVKAGKPIMMSSADPRMTR